MARKQAAAAVLKLTVAEHYLEAVRAERTVTDAGPRWRTVSKWVGLQIDRHFADLESGGDRGLMFDRAAAHRGVQFFADVLVGIDGDYSGQALQLPAWWQAVIWILYGWKRRHPKFEGRWIRRWKFGYLEVGRGNLKTLVAGSGLMVYELVSGAPGARVYAAATDRKTAKLAWGGARDMVNLSEWLRQHVEVYQDNLSTPASRSLCEPCASEDQNLMGLRPDFVYLDELHYHRTDGVWKVFETALNKKPGAMILAATNSGYDRNTVCYRKREYSEKVLQGIVPDDTWFAWMCGLDDDDDGNPNWEDESQWIKANPCLGDAVQLDDLRGAAMRAKQDPASLNDFLRFHLCVWTTKQSAWMPPHRWAACGVEQAGRVSPWQLARSRRRCWGGLDLSSTTDLTAFVLLFEPGDNDPRWRVLPFYFLPKECIGWRSRRDRVPYEAWAKQGFFVLTDGDVVDYRVVRKKVCAASRVFNLQDVAFDRWNSSDIVRDLQEDGIEMVKFGQGFAEMAMPTKRLMEMVLAGELAHGDHPVLRWNIGNVVVRQDPAGNMKMDRSKSREKIDGAIALAMAVARGMVAPQMQNVEAFFL